MEMFIQKLWISMISTNSWCFFFLIVSFVGSGLEPLMANISELRELRAQVRIAMGFDWRMYSWNLERGAGSSGDVWKK